MLNLVDNPLRLSLYPPPLPLSPSSPSPRLPPLILLTILKCRRFLFYILNAATSSTQQKVFCNKKHHPIGTTLLKKIWQFSVPQPGCHEPWPEIIYIFTDQGEFGC
jgi:hypothetical protein